MRIFRLGGRQGNGKKEVEWLMQICLGNKRELSALIWIGVVQSGAVLSAAWQVQKIISKVSSVNPEEDIGSADFLKRITNPLLLLILSVLLFSAAYFFATVVKGRFAAYTSEKLRTTMFWNIQNFTFTERNETKKGEVLTKFSNTFLIIENFLYSGVQAFLYAVTSIVLCSVFLAVISGSLFIASISFIPFVFIFSGRITKSIGEITYQQQSKLGESSALAADAIHGIKVIKSYNLQDKFTGEFQDTAYKIFQTGLKLIIRISILTPLLYIIRTIPKILCIAASAYLIYQAEMETGELLAFLFVLGGLTAGIYQMPELYAEYKKVTGALADIKELLNQPLCKETKIQTESMEFVSKKKGILLVSHRMAASEIADIILQIGDKNRI